MFEEVFKNLGFCGWVNSSVMISVVSVESCHLALGFPEGRIPLGVSVEQRGRLIAQGVGCGDRSR